ncbi:hypothetical protein RHGRI_033709 [Rhododendron griersonianum]|nr:hypothetical protein RHGRI_033709 [Rhododendron griersonianum]
MGLSSNFPDEMEILQLQGLAYPTDIDDPLATGNENILLPNFVEAGLAEILLDNSSQLYPSITGGNYGNVAGSCYGDFEVEENKNYWNNILNLVNCWPSGSPLF